MHAKEYSKCRFIKHVGHLECTIMHNNTVIGPVLTDE